MSTGINCHFLHLFCCFLTSKIGNKSHEITWNCPFGQAWKRTCLLANPSLAVEKDGQELTDPAEKPALVRDQVETCLHTLAHLGLLVEG